MHHNLTVLHFAPVIRFQNSFVHILTIHTFAPELRQGTRMNINSACCIKATHEFQTGHVDDVLNFLKRMRSELRMLRRVRVYVDRLQIIDVNGDSFEVRGVGYLDEEIIPLLDTVNTAYRRELIHDPTEDEYKEFKTGRRYPWAADRVM